MVNQASTWATDPTHVEIKVIEPTTHGDESWTIKKSIPCTSQAWNSQHGSQKSYCSSGNWKQIPNLLSRRWSPYLPRVSVKHTGAQMSWTAVTVLVLGQVSVQSLKLTDLIGEKRFQLLVKSTVTYDSIVVMINQWHYPISFFKMMHCLIELLHTMISKKIRISLKKIMIFSIINMLTCIHVRR
jgi:hypothetical protein